jgi:hypothetical protein
VTLCSLVEIYWNIRGTFCLHSILIYRKDRHVMPPPKHWQISTTASHPRRQCSESPQIEPKIPNKVFFFLILNLLSPFSYLMAVLWEVQISTSDQSSLPQHFTKMCAVVISVIFCRPMADRWPGKNQKLWSNPFFDVLLLLLLLFIETKCGQTRNYLLYDCSQCCYYNEFHLCVVVLKTVILKTCMTHCGYNGHIIVTY